jgi:hypothetical protein
MGPYCQGQSFSHVEYIGFEAQICCGRTSAWVLTAKVKAFLLSNEQCKVLVGKREGKRLIGRRCRWKGNVKMDL